MFPICIDGGKMPFIKNFLNSFFYYLSEIKFRGDLFSRGFIFADDELGFFRGVLFSRIDYVQTFRG